MSDEDCGNTVGQCEKTASLGQFEGFQGIFQRQNRGGTSGQGFSAKGFHAEENFEGASSYSDIGFYSMTQGFFYSF